jgi:hypothetical protein
MTSEQPPRIAAWFLRIFGCSPDNEAILGDLAERYRSGTSRFWYRRQVLVAVGVGLYEEITKDRFLAMRCIAAGVVLAIVLSALLQRLVLPHSLVTSYRFSSLLWILGPAVCVASVHLTQFMAGFHRSYRRAFVLLYVISFCSVLYVCWLCTLAGFQDTRTIGRIIVGGVANYLWMLSAIAGSGLFTVIARTEFNGRLQ